MISVIHEAQVRATHGSRRSCGRRLAAGVLVLRPRARGATAVPAPRDATDCIRPARDESPAFQGGEESSGSQGDRSTGKRQALAAGGELLPEGRAARTGFVLCRAALGLS